MTAGADANARTLAVYEARAATYRAQTRSSVRPALSAWLTRLATAAPEGVVLEIGSGGGLDATFLEALGRRVRRTDATVAFVELLRADGEEAEVLNVLTDDLTSPQSPYAAVLADAVFLHLTPDELASVLEKVWAATVLGGLLAFSVKVGDGTQWSDHKLGLPRFFQYWQADPLSAMVTEAGFTEVEIVLDEGGTWDWLLVTATRPLA